MSPSRFLLTCALIVFFCLGANFIAEHYPAFDKFLAHMPGGIAYIWTVVLCSVFAGFFLLKRGGAGYPAWTALTGALMVAFGIALAYYAIARLPMDPGPPM